MDLPQIKPGIRLIVQAGIPVANVADGVSEYENLKVFLLAIHPDITLNGQIIKMLEPCCSKSKEVSSHEKSP